MIPMQKLVLNPNLPEVRAFHSQSFLDQRGQFTINWATEDLRSLFRPGFLQLNSAVSTRHVLRGMHRADQTKFVYPIVGEIFDVVLEPETGNWFGMKLGPFQCLYIPPQYAHGYLVLSDTAIVQYAVDKPYDPSKEEVFPWNGYEIEWPLSFQPLLSQKDARASK